MVVGAIGQQPVLDLLKSLPGVELNGDLLKVNEAGQTSNPRYFAGGDCVNGGKEVVDAVAEGMRAARGIDVSLGSPRGND
jgi:glutamate synthase (NADPH/NADH) small chain